jgi:hypothetical protein
MPHFDSRCTSCPQQNTPRNQLMPRASTAAGVCQLLLVSSPFSNAAVAHCACLSQEVDHLGRVPSSQQQQRQPLVSGSFVPAGRSSSPVAGLRAQSSDMLLQLERQLSRDWPKSFMKVRDKTSAAVERVEKAHKRVRRVGGEGVVLSFNLRPSSGVRCGVGC